MNETYPEAGLNRLRCLLMHHVDENGDLAIEALSKADGYHTMDEIDDLLAAGLLNWEELKPTGGWAASRQMTTRFSHAEFQRLRSLIYDHYDEFRSCDITEDCIYDFLALGFLDDWVELPTNR